MKKILFEELNKTEKEQVERMIKSQIKDLVDKDLEKTVLDLLKKESKGYYKNGNRDGYWEYYYSNGELRYKDEFKNGKSIGYLTESDKPKKKLFIPRGLSDDSDNRYIKFNKTQPIKNINGKDIRINQYDLDGRKQGYWVEYSDGKLYRRYYWNDYRLENITESDKPKKKLFIPRGLSNNSDNRYLKLNKEQPIKTVNGKEIQINQYDYNGKKQGYWEEYWSNGQLESKGTYKDGKGEGYWEYYYENGQLYSKGTYKDGKEQGYWEYYHSNGQLWYDMHYNNNPI